MKLDSSELYGNQCWFIANKVIYNCDRAGVHAKTLRKSGIFFVEIEADFATPILILISLSANFVWIYSPFRC